MTLQEIMRRLHIVVLFRAHSAAAQLFQNAVMRDGLPNHGEATCSWRGMLGRG
jgi:hypothetical protein